MKKLVVRAVLRVDARRDLGARPHRRARRRSASGGDGDAGVDPVRRGRAMGGARDGRGGGPRAPEVGRGTGPRAKAPRGRFRPHGGGESGVPVQCVRGGALRNAPLVKFWRMCFKGTKSTVQEVGVDQELWDFQDEFPDPKHVHDPLDGEIGNILRQ